MLNKTRFKKKIKQLLGYSTTCRTWPRHLFRIQSGRALTSQLRYTLTYFIKLKKKKNFCSLSLFRYLFISHVWDDMHAFMALFFYELIRDQIVFIWHAWAVVVVHRSPPLSAGPCLQYFWWSWRGKKKKEILNAYLFIFVLVFIYLYRLTQDPSSTVGLFEVLLPVIT